MSVTTRKRQRQFTVRTCGEKTEVEGTTCSSTKDENFGPRTV
jgi:hypothetical protein